VLEKQLDESLGGFDRTLQGEQERVARERDSRAATSGAGGDQGDSTAAAGEAAARGGDLQSESATTATASTSSTSGDSSAAGSTGSGSGAGNRGVGQGSDDDIVARRLRRAAEQETDPELKEKLWKEYYEYKRNGQGRS